MFGFDSSVYFALFASIPISTVLSGPDSCDSQGDLLHHCNLQLHGLSHVTGPESTVEIEIEAKRAKYTEESNPNTPTSQVNL